MTDKTVRGRFVWHELMTPDPGAAHAFYNRVLGWKTATWDQNPSYTMFANGSERLGGTVANAEGAPHWVHYIGTPDLDATLQQATSLGASVVKEPTVISGDSRYAVLTDPQGAAFALYSSSSDPAQDRQPKRGEFSWMELATTDAKAALEFYCALFGWERTAAHDMGPMGFYYLFGRNGRELGGVFDKPAEMPGPPAWLGYIRGKDLDKVVNKVKAGGGSLINGPMEVPGGDWIAQFVDPHGAMFAVHVVKDDLQQAAPAPEPAPAPAKIEVSAAPVVRKSAANKSTARRKTPKKKAAPARKRSKVKSVKRSVRKAVRVRTRSLKVKAKAAGRKKSGVKKKAAKARKGK